MTRYYLELLTRKKIMMNKSDVVKGIAAQRPDLTVAQVETIVNDFLDVIGMSLACEEDVRLSGFGKFEVRHRRAVTRRNPKTGEPIAVPEKRSLGFVPSPKLKDRVNRT